MSESAPRILLVNPPIFDFSAYDFWAKPYGLLQVAGRLRRLAEISLFDFLDRSHPAMSSEGDLRRDGSGRGEYRSEIAQKPRIFRDIARHYKRFGLPKGLFESHLKGEEPYDFALVQSVMTYWYPGLVEVIEVMRRLSPGTKIAIGGPYATLCPGHTRSLGPDLVVRGGDLAPLWDFLGMSPEGSQQPFWEGYGKIESAALRLNDGCPCRCTYCSVPVVGPGFRPRDTADCIREIEFAAGRGAKNIAFYDDALLHRAEESLVPFLTAVREMRFDVRFHTPNAISARMLTGELARLMVSSGFESFYIGFESSSIGWQERTGGKVGGVDLWRAVENLLAAGASRSAITAYILLGHPSTSTAQVEDSLRFANDLGIRAMLSDFSPVPGTADGEACAGLADMSEPLSHNKTAFPIWLYGKAEVDRLKGLCKRLNASLSCS